MRKQFVPRGIFTHCSCAAYKLLIGPAKTDTKASQLHRRQGLGSEASGTFELNRRLRRSPPKDKIKQTLMHVNLARTNDANILN